MRELEEIPRRMMNVSFNNSSIRNLVAIENDIFLLLFGMAKDPDIYFNIFVCFVHC